MDLPNPDGALAALADHVTFSLVAVGVVEEDERVVIHARDSATGWTPCAARDGAGVGERHWVLRSERRDVGLPV